MDYCYLLDVMLCGLVVIAEIVAAIIGIIALQFIFVKVFKINPILKFWRFLEKLDKKLNKYFNQEEKIMKMYVNKENLNEEELKKGRIKK